MFTTNAKELVINPLHARVPMNYITKGVWLNLSIDVFSFSNHCFKGCVHRAIDGITLGAHCKIRRIFTMKGPILDTNDEEIAESGLAGFETLPKYVEYPMGVCFYNQVYTSDKIGIDNTNINNENLMIGPSHIEPAKNIKTIQVAFGSRAPIPKVMPKSPDNATITGYDNKTKKGFHMTANQDFSKQLTNTTTSLHTNVSSTHSTQASISKRSSRFKNLKELNTGHLHVLRTPDVRCPRTPIEAQQINVNNENDRDKSEPPRKDENQKCKSKSPMGRQSTGVCHTKQLSKNLITINAQGKKSHAQRTLMFDEKHDESIAEDKNESQNDPIQINDYSHKSEKAKNENSGTLKPKAKIPVNRHAKKPPVGTKKSTKVEPKSAKKSPKKEENPSSMLLQTIGANQLNTFGIQNCPEEASDEIEEEIEIEEKQETVAHKEIDEGNTTPLYFLITLNLSIEDVVY